MAYSSMRSYLLALASYSPSRSGGLVWPHSSPVPLQSHYWRISSSPHLWVRRNSHSTGHSYVDRASLSDFDVIFHPPPTNERRGWRILSNGDWRRNGGLVGVGQPILRPGRAVRRREQQITLMEE